MLIRVSTVDWIESNSVVSVSLASRDPGATKPTGYIVVLAGLAVPIFIKCDDPEKGAEETATAINRANYGQPMGATH